MWLTPVYQQQAANSFGTAGYHGYWPADFRNVDPHFGTLADFGTFVKAAQGAGMRVVLDQVINHYGYEAAAVRLRKDWFNTQATCDATQNKDVDCPCRACRTCARATRRCATCCWATRTSGVNRA